MIEVSITSKAPDGVVTELGTIRIENVGGNEELADYSIQFGIDRYEAVGLYQRAIYGFPRLQYNVLGLLRQALETLDPEELTLEHAARSSNLARRRRGPLKEVQAWASRLRHH